MDYQIENPAKPKQPRLKDLEPGDMLFFADKCMVDVANAKVVPE